MYIKDHCKSSSLTLNSLKSLPNKCIFCEIKLSLWRSWLLIKAEPSTVINSSSLTVISSFWIEDRTNSTWNFVCDKHQFRLHVTALILLIWVFKVAMFYISLHLSFFLTNPKQCGQGLYEAGSNIILWRAPPYSQFITYFLFSYCSESFLNFWVRLTFSIFLLYRLVVWYSVSINLGSHPALYPFL